MSNKLSHIPLSCCERGGKWVRPRYLFPLLSSHVFASICKCSLKIYTTTHYISRTEDTTGIMEWNSHFKVHNWQRKENVWCGGLRVCSMHQLWHTLKSSLVCSYLFLFHPVFLRPCTWKKDYYSFFPSFLFSQQENPKWDFKGETRESNCIFLLCDVYRETFVQGTTFAE